MKRKEFSFEVRTYKTQWRNLRKRCLLVSSGRYVACAVHEVGNRNSNLMKVSSGQVVLAHRTHNLEASTEIEVSEDEEGSCN